MMPTYYGNVVVSGRATTASALPVPQGEVDGMELTGEAAIRHSSGAYIRFSPEGDIHLVPAPGRHGYLGDVEIK